MATAIYHAEVPPEVPFDHPDNRLIVAPGILQGSNLPGAGRHGVGAKSPLNEGYGEADVGGFFGAELRRSDGTTVIETQTGAGADPERAVNDVLTWIPTVIDGHGLVAYWPFNNDTYDYGGANDVTANYGATPATGRIGNSMSFSRRLRSLETTHLAWDSCASTA